MRRSLLLLLFLSIGLLLYAQEPVRFGDHEVYLEANVHPPRRNYKTSSLELGTPAGEKLNVLVQFNTAPISQEALAKKGVVLGDYLGGNAYYAQIAPGSRPSDFVGTGLRTVVPIRSEWKVVTALLQHKIPTWARQNDNIRMRLSWFSSVSWEQVKTELDRIGVSYRANSPFFKNVEIEGSYEQILALAEYEGIAFIQYCKPPEVLSNYHGARLSGGSLLSRPTSLYGRGLTGKNVRIGIWDANIGDHVDYGTRVHNMEFEDPIIEAGSHGMHTSGTIVGSGLCDERGRGLAPAAQLWAYNFGNGLNGKSSALEMYETYIKEHISLTSNSYGYALAAFCEYESFFTYTELANIDVDYLAYYIPDLTHVFAAGNDQDETRCALEWSHATNYSKNIISVGAVNTEGRITSFSSFGPLRDGRLFPIISARGEEVYSTIYGQAYKAEDGTSMACPTVTGHLALLSERWMQLHGGAAPYNYYLKALVANTAQDVGNPGPDYKYGFGILDAEAAVVALENNWHALKALEQGGAEQEIKITVPDGVKELRVALCWSDPVVNKEYAYGECPIVNDLDLTLHAQGKMYYPYTLNPAEPHLPAVATQRNKVDNIEQVRILAPTAGECTIKVGGTVRQGAKQPYAVVWYFDYQKPEIVSPQIADINSPDEELYLHTKNMIAPLRVELSTDGGKSYEVLGQFANNSVFTLPSPIVATNKASLRVIDAQGLIVTTAGYFTIMPRVQDLQLTSAPCSTLGWQLAWNAVDEAAKYKILRADLEKETYNEIAEVEGTTTTYALQDNQVSAARNMYAVQAISASGLCGARSRGVITNQPQPKVLTLTDLPYTETFVGWPMQHVAVITGSKLEFSVQEPHPRWGFPLKSQMIAWEGKSDAPDWDKPFEQRDHVGSISACGIDLTNIPLGTQLQLVSYCLLKKPKEDGQVGSLLRVLVDGKELADELGREVIEGDGDEHRIAWDISKYAGEKIALNFEAALASDEDGAIIAYYQILQKTDRPDVGIAWVNDPKIDDMADMHEETIRFSVQNYSTCEVKNVPVSVLVDDKLVYTNVFQTLKPFEGRTVSYKHDFTSQEPHKFNVRVRAEISGDIDPTNNEKEFEVYNIGNVIAMPEVVYFEFFGQSIRKVPYISRKINGKQLFVDGRGALEPYKTDQEGVLQIVPTASNRIVQATFREYDLAEGDTLAIFTGNVPTNLKVAPRNARIKLTGKSTTPQVFVSEADNGGLTFCFVGYNERTTAGGWIAEVQEFEAENQWKLESLITVDGEEVNSKKVQATIENLLPVDLYNVGLYVTVNGMFERYTIPVLKASSQTIYTLPQQFNTTPPARYEIVAQLVKDGDVSDNEKKLTLEYDPLWHNGTIAAPEKLYIASLRTVDSSTVQIQSQAKVNYMPQHIVPLYMQSNNVVWLTLSGKPTTNELPSQLRVWIDANDNNTLEDAELTMVEVVANKLEYQIAFNLSNFPEIKVGKHRMRLMLSTESDYQKFVIGETIVWGHVVDLTADVKDGNNLYDYELSLVSLVAPVTGHSLTGAEKVTVRVRNNGVAPQKNVELVLTVDEQEVATESIPCALAAVGGEAELSFSKPIDLSAQGKHLISVALKNADNNTKDNEIKERVFNIAPQTNTIYGLSFVGNEREAIELPLQGHNVDKECTIEGWWLLNKPQRCELVNEEGIWLASLAGSDQFPDNTLVFMAGNSGLLLSKTPVLKPGKWQHIAVSMKVAYGWSGEMTTHPTVYIDGELVEMERYGNGILSFKNLLLNVKFDGQLAMFRLWNKERGSADLLQNMTKSVRTADNKLPSDCVGEYIFTEGQGIASAYGQGRYAVIHSQRPDVWNPIQRIVASAHMEGEKVPPQYVETNKIKIIVPTDFTEFDKVKVTFDLDWLGATVSHNGTVVLPETELNFETSSDHTLQFKAEKKDFFGATLVQEFSIKLENDASGACDLVELAMQKADNPGLKDEILLTNCDQTLKLNVKQEGVTPIDVRNLKLVAKQLSPGAKLYYEERAIEPNTPFVVDFSVPVYLRVVAQNGRDIKYYTLTLAMEQNIQWGTEKITRAFTKEPLRLDAKATSGLSVQYISANPSVVSFDPDGKCIVAGVGTTTIRATQTGNAQYLAASSVERAVEITPAPLTIKMKDARMAQGDPMPEFEFEYEGLQFENTQYKFDIPYEILDAKGLPWEGTEQLAQGEYVVRPKGYTVPVRRDNYQVTYNNGKLIVAPASAAQKVTFKVIDETGNVLPDIALKCAQYRLQTNENGIAELYLTPATYQVYARKTDYATAKVEFVVTNQVQTVHVQLRRLVHELSYTADAFGVIQGKATQRVANGGNGERVIAVPITPSYRFKRWSDGSTEASRVDMNVTKGIAVRAEFEEASYTLSYKLGKGGKWVAGQQTQTVQHGKNGTSVEVEPLDGWVFIGWSDGNEDAMRTDTDVVKDIDVEAQFFKPHLLTWTENFDLGDDVLRYWFFDVQSEGEGWKLVPSKTVLGAAAEGEILKIEPVGQNPFYHECFVETPWLSLAGRSAAGGVKISYDLYYKKARNTSAVLEYSFDEEDWTSIEELEEGSGTRKTSVIPDGNLAGNDFIRFRWVFTSENFNTYLAIDNISVSLDPQPEEQTMLRYFAGEHGKLMVEGETEKVKTVEVQTKKGVDGAKVTAVPDAGYLFDKWSDGKMEATRQDQQLPVTVGAFFRRQLKIQYTLSYKVKGNGILEGVLYQRLEEGEMGTPVYARPSEGNKFVRWSDGVTDNPRSDVATATTTYEAEFEVDAPKRFVVTLAKKGEGELKITGIEESKLNAVPEGTELTAVATPAKGWKLKSLMAGTQDISSDGKFTVTANVEVKAVFEKEGTIPQPTTFAVTLKKDGEGELKVTGIEESKLNVVPEGTELTAVATPAKGWKLKSLTAGTQDILSDGKFTVTANVEVKAVFEKSTFVEDAMLANVLVAPNPFDNQLRIVNGDLRGEYALLNAQGAVVRSGNMAGNEVLIETSDLTSGLYLLRLTAENGATKTITVVKDR